METRKHSKTMGGSFKNKVCEKNKNIDPKSILERILRSFYGPFAVFLGPGVVLDRFFRSRQLIQKKVMRLELGDLALGTVGPLNYSK